MQKKYPQPVLSDLETFFLFSCQHHFVLCNVIVDIFRVTGREGKPEKFATVQLNLVQKLSSNCA